MNISELSREWIEEFNRAGADGRLASSVNYDDIFDAKELYGKQLFTLPMWTVHFPTGRIVACDPLVSLRHQENTYIRTVPPGTYLLETKVAEIEPGHYRYLASRVVFNGHKTKFYELALKGNEDFSQLEENSYFGFPVDSGLATIVDEATIKAYAVFYDGWYENNPDKNIYDDYFSEVFQINALSHPQYQREKGDWINFTIPETDLTVPMIQSGFGDGLYPVYWGFDDKNEICQIVMEYIDCSER